MGNEEMEISVDRVKYRLINLVVPEINSRQEDYLKIDDPERKLAIITSGLHWFQDYDLIFDSTPSLIPFLPQHRKIKKVVYSRSSQILDMNKILKNFNKTWYVNYFQLSQRDTKFFYDSFTYPKLFLHFENEHKQYQKIRNEKANRLRKHFRELIKYTKTHPNSIPAKKITLSKGKKIEIICAVYSLNDAIRSEKYKDLCATYACITPTLAMTTYLPLCLRKVLKSGIYKATFIVEESIYTPQKDKKTYSPWTIHGLPIVLELQEAKLLKNIKDNTNSWQNFTTITNFKKDLGVEIILLKNKLQDLKKSLKLGIKNTIGYIIIATLITIIIIGLIKSAVDAMYWLINIIPLL